MAVAPSTLGPAVTGAAAATLSTTHTAAGTDRLAIVTIGIARNINDIVSGVTYDGVAMTRYAAASGGGTASMGFSCVYYLVNPPTTTNASVVASFSTTGNNVVWGVESWTGVDQTTPLTGGVNTARASSTVWTDTLTIPAGGAGVQHCEQLQVGAFTSLTQTVIYNAGLGSGTTTCCGATQRALSAGGGSVTFSMTSGAGGRSAGFVINAVAATPRSVVASRASRNTLLRR